MRGEQNVSMERRPWGGPPLYTNINGKEQVPPVRWKVTPVDRTSAKVSLDVLGEAGRGRSCKVRFAKTSLRTTGTCYREVSWGSCLLT